MPLFVKLATGTALDSTIEEKIRNTLREQLFAAARSGKNIPGRGIPYTLTGNKLEVPVRKILLGMPANKAANRNVMSNPASLDYFVEFAKEQADYSLS